MIFGCNLYSEREVIHKRQRGGKSSLSSHVTWISAGADGAALRRAKKRADSLLPGVKSKFALKFPVVDVADGSVRPAQKRVSAPGAVGMPCFCCNLLLQLDPVVLLLENTLLSSFRQF